VYSGVLQDFALGNDVAYGPIPLDGCFVEHFHGLQRDQNALLRPSTVNEHRFAAEGRLLDWNVK
jgi:hypothetical protein